MACRSRGRILRGLIYAPLSSNSSEPCFGAMSIILQINLRPGAKTKQHKLPHLSLVRKTGITNPRGRGCVPELPGVTARQGLSFPCAPHPLRLLNPRIIPAQAGGMLLQQACSGILGCDALVVLMEIPSTLENWLCGERALKEFEILG